MKHNEFFRKHPIFTGEELAKHLRSRGGVGARAQEALLAYHRRTGRVVRVRRVGYMPLSLQEPTPTLIRSIPSS